jgi:hypothetical protein
MESRLNFIEWHIGIPPGLMLVKEQLGPNLETLPSKSTGDASLSFSYQKQNYFYHELSSNILLRYGFDQNNY